MQEKKNKLINLIIELEQVSLERGIISGFYNSKASEAGVSDDEVVKILSKDAKLIELNNRKNVLHKQILELANSIVEFKEEKIFN